MTKVVLSDEEFGKLKSPKQKPKAQKSKKVVISDEEFSKLDDPEDKGIVDTALEKVMGGMEWLEARTQAPARAAVSAALGGENPLEAAYEQYAEDPRQAPSGKDIAMQVGVPDEDPFFPEIKPVHPQTGETLGEGTTPADWAGLGVDVLVDPLNIVPGVMQTKLVRKMAKGTKAVIRGAAEKNAFKALAMASKATDKFESLMPDVVGRVLIDNDLGPYLNKPLKLKEKIMGKRKYKSAELGEAVGGDVYPVEYYESTSTGGLIGETSRTIDSNIKAIRETASRIDLNKLIDQLVERKRNSMMSVMGETENLPELKKYEDFLRRTIGKTNKPVNIYEAHKIKKLMGSKVKSEKFLARADERLLMEDSARMDVVRELKKSIEDAAIGTDVYILDKATGEKVLMDGGNFIKSQNQKNQYLIEIGRALEGKSMEEIKKQGLGQLVASAVGGAMGGGIIGAMAGMPPLYWALAGSGVLGGQRAGQMVSRAYPGMMARNYSRMEKIPEAMRQGAQALPLMNENLTPMDPATREPQSLPEQLVRTPIPRDVDWIVANKDFVLAKVAQMYPDAYDTVNDMISHEPEKLEQAFPALIEMAPEMFEFDKYNRVNGKITSPMDRARAEEDTMRRDDLSNTEKINIINRLNRTGEFD